MLSSANKLPIDKTLGVPVSRLSPPARLVRRLRRLGSAEERTTTQSIHHPRAMADADSNVPGGYFMGRPSNAPEPAESKPVNTQTPGDYFIGTPEHRPAGTAAGQAKPTGDQKKSKSFLECLPCLGGGQVAN